MLTNDIPYAKVRADTNLAVENNNWLVGTRAKAFGEPYNEDFERIR
jgi:hypothetical protein